MMADRVGAGQNRAAVKRSLGKAGNNKAALRKL
jgi:hypothetical protein